MRLIVFLWTFVPLSAQWLHYPTPGVPRTPDGKPNLSAPAPKTADGKPDLSGVWVSAGTKYFFDLTADGVEAPLLPAAAAKRAIIGWPKPGGQRGLVGGKTL